MKNKITLFKFTLSMILLIIGTYFIYLSLRMMLGFNLKTFVLNFTNDFFAEKHKFSEIFELIYKYLSLRFEPDGTFLTFVLLILGVVFFLMSVILIVRKITEKKYFYSGDLFDNIKITKIIIAFSLLFSLNFLFQNFNEPISRFNSFKQAEVASNIYYYVNDGFGLEERLFVDNEQLKFFSFPFYQWTSAVVCKLTGLEIEQGARLVNIILFFLNFILFYNLFNFLKLKPVLIALSLFIFSTSPLVIYYYRAVHPDPMAIYFSYLSLYHFIKYDKGNKYKYFILAIIWGIVASFIKNPIYLMVFITILYYRYSVQGFKSFLKRDMLIFVISIGLSVILYKLLADFINEGLTLKTFWIFGDFIQRVSIKPYFLLTIWQTIELINPIFFIFSIIFIVPKLFRIQSNEYKIVINGLFIGMITTIGIFFNVFQAHDYYHLPFVIIYSAAIVLFFYEFLLKNFLKNRILTYLVLIAFIFIQLSWFFLAKYPTIPDNKIILGAEFIKENTEPNSYVIYTTSENLQTWDPTYLFNSRRKGFNISIRNIEKQVFLDSILNRFAINYDKIYLYLPKYLENNLKTIPNSFSVFKVNRAGKLFVIKK